MASSLPDCAMCNNPATLRCSSCRCRSLYCSKPCQKADWKLHKILCSTRPSFETPPTADSRRAIAFLPDGDLKFVWVTTQIKTEDEEVWESPVGLEKYFRKTRPVTQIYHCNVVRGRTLKDAIDLKLNDTFLMDGSEKNLAVCKVVPGMDDGGAVWRDSLVALKMMNCWYDNKTRSGMKSAPDYGHMDMGDFREVVDYLTQWKRKV